MKRIEIFWITLLYKSKFSVAGNNMYFLIIWITLFHLPPQHTKKQSQLSATRFVWARDKQIYNFFNASPKYYANYWILLIKWTLNGNYFVFVFYTYYSFILHSALLSEICYFKGEKKQNVNIKTHFCRELIIFLKLPYKKHGWCLMFNPLAYNLKSCFRILRETYSSI